MKVLKWIFIVLVALLAILIIIGFAMPKEVKVTTTEEIKLSPAKVFHFVMIIVLAVFGFFVNMNWIYYSGLTIATILLFLQHNIVNPNDERLMKIASYNLNQIISIIICLCGITDVWV